MTGKQPTKSEMLAELQRLRKLEQFVKDWGNNECPDHGPDAREECPPECPWGQVFR